MTFSNTSKTLRKEKGLSQVQLAEALNISKLCCYKIPQNSVCSIFWFLLYNFPILT